MSILNSLKNSVKKHLDKKKEERETLERLQRESKVEEQRIFEDNFRKNALEVAKIKAIKDAAKFSGLQKLRAENRIRRLSEVGNKSPSSWFSQLSDYTQKNKLKRDENLKRTEEMRNIAKTMREEKLTEQQRIRGERLVNRKPFGY